MAAVVSTPFSHTPGFHRPESMAEHRSSFTAVNGAPLAPPTANMDNGSEHPKVAQDHNSAGNNPSATISEDQRLPPMLSQAPATAKSASDVGTASHAERAQEPAHPERRTSPTSPVTAAPTPGSTLAAIINPTNLPSPSERPPPHIPSLPAIHQAPIENMTVKPGESVSVQASSPSTLNPQKRKRSASIERETLRNPSYNQPAPQSPRDSRISNGVDTTTEAEPYSPRQTYPPPQPIYAPTQGESYRPPPHAHAYPPPPEPLNTQAEPYPRPNGAGRNDYDQNSEPSMTPSQDRPYYSESHLAEALQRENRSYEPESRRESYAAQDDSDERPQQYATYGGSREAGTADLDRKRRKRVFSNRTKTGCMTCRRRKKKCDEAHPECNNCLRGGFVCEGYTIRNTWQKPANTKQPVPLQSKNGFPPQDSTPSRAPYPPMNRYPDSGMDYTPRSSISAATPSYEAKQGSISEHESVYGKNSPPSDKGQPTWSKGAQTNRPYPSNPPAASKYQGSEHRGSIYEIGSEREDNVPMPPPPVGRTGSAQSQYSQVGPPAGARTTPPNSNAQAAAQAALTQTSRLPNSREQYTEREKMLKGMYYYPNTPALTEDRERCIAAIWRFNNATNPSHGASPEERTRLFRQILSLKPSPEPPLSTGEAPQMTMPLPMGSCGERVVVEAPFHCDYGYNITVGDDVLIGADCRISDTCAVTIGARCILSPNVKLICATYPIDPRRRLGSNGPALGRNITIEEDCWIGAGVTILAGVRVGKSSTVGAGSLLHQDVPRWTVVAGNPAKVSRGIYEGSGDSQ